MNATRLRGWVAAVRRVGVRVLLAVGLIQLAVVLWLLAGLPVGIDRWLNVTERPTASDAIVCVGSGTSENNLPTEEGWSRIYTAVQLFADDYAPLVVFSGGGMSRLTEAEAYADAAAWLGLPRGAVMLDPLPIRTADHPDAILTSSHGRITRDSRLLLVTSAAHSRRVLLTFRKHGFSHVRVVATYQARNTVPGGPPNWHARTSGFAEYRPSPRSYDDPFNRLKWRSADLLTALREFTAIAWYRARGLL